MVTTTFKVRTEGHPKDIAGAIAGELRRGNKVELQMVGAGAVNQAIKAIIVARGYLVPQGHADLCVQPSFLNIKDENDLELTGIRLLVEIPAT